MNGSHTQMGKDYQLLITYNTVFTPNYRIIHEKVACLTNPLNITLLNVKAVT